MQRPPHSSRRAAVGLLLLLAAGCRADYTPAPWPSEPSSSASTGAGGAGGTGGSAGGAGGEAPAGEPLAVLTWNTKNFFNDQDDSAVADELVLSPAQYKEKREAVAAVLKALDPDIAVLQEVESLAVLQDLNEIDLGNAYPYAALIEANDPRGIDVGALSKVPFEEVVTHKDETFAKLGTQGPFFTFARDCLELHVAHGGRKVVLLGVHFRSKSPPDDPDRRLAEAQRTRAIADEIAAEHPTAAIAVLGDVNDLPGSPALLALAGSGEVVYDDVASLAPPADRWTYNYQGALELIDHQMASPTLRAMLDEASVAIPHGAEIQGASDHAPILAIYRVTPAP